jgi:branched-chain amino acid transport system substrate-binding protein
LTAAGAQHADAIVPVADGPNCVKIAKALQQIGSRVPVVSVPNCLDPQVMKALGDFPKWYYGIAATLSADTTAPDVAAYDKASSAYGLKPGDAFDPFAQLAWGQVLLTAKLMNQIGAGKLSPAALGTALKSYTGTYPMGPPSLACGSSPASEPTSCNDKTQFYLYEGKGKFKLSGPWVAGP